MDDEFLTEKEVSELTKLSVQTLRNNRSKGKGIPYVRFGKSVRYRKSDINKYIEDHTVIPEK